MRTFPATKEVEKLRGYVNAFDVIKNWCKHWKPDCSFAGKTKNEFEEWRKRFRTHYRRCIGRFPQKVPLRARTVERVDRGSYVRERVIYDSSPGISVPAYILIPKAVKRGERRSGILAAHGHGGGKDDICGVTREKSGGENIQRLNYEYALEAVERGYVVIAPDWCPFGQRRPPDWWSRSPRDACNIVNLAFQYFGLTLLAQNV